jgi:hypothetical protein
MNTYRIVAREIVGQDRSGVFYAVTCEEQNDADVPEWAFVWDYESAILALEELALENGA